ncbi:DUF2066 domain-containing protein [Thalassotalea crassostreae]|uniref:DUF2066 domain-containing protein n=1 Tax=Thalassotalea crassostreae TaxID=1763536 RepID=UPI0008393EDB|nr:DUF2066 domain-containing protein [Thalassotalea crassostreae]
MNYKKLLKKAVFCCALTLNLISFQTVAVEVANLYTAEVVLDDSKNAKSKANQVALKRVLIRLAGSEFVNSNEQLKKALKKPNSYLTQFSYGEKNGNAVLFAQFEEAKINQLLQSAKASIWGKHRPMITMWMVEENGLERDIVADSSQGIAKQVIVEVAKRRGLPLNLPLMDLSDSMAITVGDVWGRFEENIKKASKRYQAEAIAVIRLSNTSLVNNTNEQCGSNPGCQKSEYAIDWHVFNNGEMYTNSFSGNDRQKLISKAMTDMAESLHQKNSYVFDGSAENVFDVEIVNIDSMIKFVEIKQFLNDLTLVSDVKLIKVAGTKMVFRLELLASVNAIKQALQLEKSLDTNNDYFDSSSEVRLIDGDNAQSYTWKG